MLIFFICIKYFLIWKGIQAAYSIRYLTKTSTKLQLMTYLVHLSKLNSTSGIVWNQWGTCLIMINHLCNHLGYRMISTELRGRGQNLLLDTHSWHIDDNHQNSWDTRDCCIIRQGGNYAEPQWEDRSRIQHRIISRVCIQVSKKQNRTDRSRTASKIRHRMLQYINQNFGFLSLRTKFDYSLL